jgi:hypothetical protein
MKMRGAVAAAGGGGGRFGGGGGAGGRGAGPAPRERGLLPTNPVHDLKIHPRDHELIVATHGRGIFIADISPFEELSAPVLGADAHLFEVAPAIRWTGGERGSTASSNFDGMSRSTDIGITYYLKGDAAGDVKIRIYDGSRMIAEMDGPKSAGLNTVRWNMQERRDRIPGEGQATAGRGGRGGGGFAGRGGGGAAGDAGAVFTEARLGDYRVVLSVGGKDYERTAQILAGK